MKQPINSLEEAVAAHLEFLEMGGMAPDLTQLSADMRAQVDEVTGMLELTEGVALRTAHPQLQESSAYLQRRRAELLIDTATTDLEKELLTKLDAALPAGAAVDSDYAPAGFCIPDLPVTGAFTVGTVGGRVRVWLVDVAQASDLERDTSHLISLDRVFRAFPETAGICLVCRDFSCLLLEPEDCAPVIEVPAGEFTARHYRRPIRPFIEALSVFVRELIPAWEVLPRFVAGSAQAMDVYAIARQAAEDSVQLIKDSGARARYPKKQVLGALGTAEVSSLSDMAIALYEGRRDAGEILCELRRLGGGR